MGFWNEVSEVKSFLHLLGQIDKFHLYNRSKDRIVSDDILDDMKYRVKKWKEEILDRFDEYFIKQANLVVLDRKKKELEGD